MKWLFVLFLLFIHLVWLQKETFSAPLVPPFDVLYQGIQDFKRILQTESSYQKRKIQLDTFWKEFRFQRCDTYQHKGLYCYQIDEIFDQIKEILNEHHQFVSPQRLLSALEKLAQKTKDYGIRAAL